MAAEQIEWKGVPPTVVPYVPPNKFNDQHPKPQSIWADVVAIAPWDLYNTFGDERIMEKQWGSMRMWLDEGVPRGKDGLWSEIAPQYGDWLDPNAPRKCYFFGDMINQADFCDQLNILHMGVQIHTLWPMPTLSTSRPSLRKSVNC